MKAASYLVALAGLALAGLTTVFFRQGWPVLALLTALFAVACLVTAAVLVALEPKHGRYLRGLLVFLSIAACVIPGEFLRRLLSRPGVVMLSAEDGEVLCTVASRVSGGRFSVTAYLEQAHQGHRLNTDESAGTPLRSGERFDFQEMRIAKGRQASFAVFRWDGGNRLVILGEEQAAFWGSFDDRGPIAELRIEVEHDPPSLRTVQIPIEIRSHGAGILSIESSGRLIAFFRVRQ